MNNSIHDWSTLVLTSGSKETFDNAGLFGHRGDHCVANARCLFNARRYNTNINSHAMNLLRSRILVANSVNAFLSTSNKFVMLFLILSEWNINITLLT